MKQILGITLLLISFKDFHKKGLKRRTTCRYFTPSVLLNKGQWDIKFFNGLYTQTRQTGANSSNGVDIPRQTFFTSTLEVFTGVSENKRVNLGVILEYRSNTLGGENTFSVFNFQDSPTSRNGLSTIAPAIKIQPFKNVGTFLYLRHCTFLHSAEAIIQVFFLDQSAWALQNRYFYDYTFQAEMAVVYRVEYRV